MDKRFRYISIYLYRGCAARHPDEISVGRLTSGRETSTGQLHLSRQHLHLYANVKNVTTEEPH